ncbi:MAG TPA: MerR family transcriptional regulator [Ktedonobacteraceae bacterium]|nr:MerR family transcriptional regulator [Ktedonobacteraceae bacterium]
MRKQLQIGEVAQLLGITPKTIRHYQRIGLIREPERSEAGYRLYGAQDLLRLQQIRRLQALGISLKQIKAILGDPAQQQTVREVLLELDWDLQAQIQNLEARRQRIKTLLDDDEINVLDPPSTSPTFETMKTLLAEHLDKISPAVLEQEARLDAVLDTFNWPSDYKESMLQVGHFFNAHPDLYASLFTFGEQFAALATLPEDAPEVDQLLTKMQQGDEAITQLLETIAMIQPEMPSQPAPFANILGDLMAETLSPAQRRFLQALTH